MDSTELRVFQVFKSVLSISNDTARELLVYNQYASWDSVAHMAIVAGLEASFDCMLDMQDILDMNSFQKSVEIMRKYSAEG
jgi:acyl carrier protein